jgi:predicted dehydrogenase
VNFRGFPHSLPTTTTFDVEEQMTVLARTATGCVFTFDLSWIGHQHSCMQAHIRGVDGGIALDWQAGEKGQPFTFFADGESPWQWLNTTTDWRSKASGNDRIYEDLCRSIRGENIDIGTTPDQAIAITRLTLMAQKSAELGREVKAEEITAQAKANG